MRDILVPHEILARYPLSLPTVVAALWELYMVQVPANQLKLVFAARPLLERLGKTYSSDTLVELEVDPHELDGDDDGKPCERIKPR